MSSTSPINDLPIPDDDSPGDPPIHFAALSAALDARLIPVFDSATERDDAFALWVAAGNTMREGMYCHLNDDGRLWEYNGTVWAWPRWAQGEIAYVSRSSQAGPASTIGAWVPVSGLSVSFTLPSPRKIRATFSGQMMSDQIGTQLLIRINNTTTSTTKPSTVCSTKENYGIGTALFLRQSLAAGTYTIEIDIQRLFGPGSAYLTGDLAELLIEDIGAPAS